MTRIRTVVWLSLAASVVGCSAATSPSPQPPDPDPDPVKQTTLTKVTYHVPGMNREFKIL